MKCVTAVSLAGSLIIGGMVVTSVHVAGAKTNDTQQVGGNLSNTNDVGQVEGGTNGVEQVGGDDSGTNAPPNPLARPLLGLRLGNPPPAVSFVTDESISNQWRVVSVSSNALAATTFTMPAHATVWEDARDFGAGWGS
ncbi:MAG: hypothetical protein MJ249_09310, partial [Kiritimatiellae bacterium]|nr:hypothetical protein [Kiritimatiellia bacterium]